jgi:hypothetical protein
VHSCFHNWDTMKSALDFIVIGAMKSGTTSLFEHLRQHPEVALPPGKEAPYFSHEDEYRRGWQEYLEKGFFRVDPALKWGSVTGQYMVGGLWETPHLSADGHDYGERTVPRRIRNQLPDVRLIAVLRDPVARAQSYHRMALLNGWDDRPFDKAIDDLLRPAALHDARRVPTETTGYVAWGEYGRILSGYFDVFPREQMLILFTRDLEANPELFLRRIFEFIGVAADFVPPDIGVKYRVGSTKQRFRALGFQSPLNPWSVQRAVTGSALARRVWHALPDQGRRRVDRAYTRAAYEVDLWNRSSEVSAPDVDQATVQRLRAHYESDSRLLVSLLGSEPPWPTTGADAS